MESILNTGVSWSFEKLEYSDSLMIFIVEMIKSQKPTPLIIEGINLGNSYIVAISEESRRFIVQFKDVISYQIQKESYTYHSESDLKSQGILSKYEKSRYLDFIESHTLIRALQKVPYYHYSLFLDDEIIDVISGVEPQILSK